MTRIYAHNAGTSRAAGSGRFDALDFARGLAILGMLGSHLVGTEGGNTVLERGVTGVLATIEPTVGALFCVLAGMAWTIQAERVGVTPRFRWYMLGRAAALGVLGVVFHVLFWKTEILVPFALMMAASVVVLGSGPRTTMLALLLFVAATPVVERFVAPWAAADWLENGLHVADSTVGWVTLRYLFFDGNYPFFSWMAFPLMGMIYWQTARSRTLTLRWFFGSLGVAVVTYAVAAYMTPEAGVEPVRRWIASGWTPTSAVFLLTAGSGALATISALRWWWGTASMPRPVQPLVLFGRASLSHYVLHIAIAYSGLTLLYPGEDWLPGTGLRALLLYLSIGIPLTVFWFRHHTHGPVEALLARSSRRPQGRATSDGGPGQSLPIEVIRENGSARLSAVRSFAPGDVIFPLEGRRSLNPTRFTIQIGPNSHLDPVSDGISPWLALNHSCDPNVTVDVTRSAIIARRPIATGDELRFDYNTTEWELAESFVCNCGAPWCVGRVMGFVHLPLTRQRTLLSDAAPHIRALSATRPRAATARSSREAISRATYGTSNINVKTL